MLNTAFSIIFVFIIFGVCLHVKEVLWYPYFIIFIFAFFRSSTIAHLINDSINVSRVLCAQTNEKKRFDLLYGNDMKTNLLYQWSMPVLLIL